MDVTVSAPLPAGENAEIAIRRSLLDEILRRRALSLGAEMREGETLVSVRRENESVEPAIRTIFPSRRNFWSPPMAATPPSRGSANLMPRKGRDRVALQTHVPMPPDFGERVVLQFCREGYSGQAPVGDGLAQSLSGQPA